MPRANLPSAKPAASETAGPATFLVARPEPTPRQKALALVALAVEVLWIGALVALAIWG